MNISLNHNVIWVAPEETGERVFAEIFEDYDFYQCLVGNNSELKEFGITSYSNSNKIPEKYQDFDIFCSIRNPYDRIWACYVNLYTTKFNPKTLETIKKNFNQFLDDVFWVTTDGIKIDPFFSENSYFSKWTFEDIIPNTFIKYENLYEDLKKLKFLNFDHLKLSETEMKQKISKIDSSFDFRDLYDVKNANKIFHFYKKTFYMLDYDPFSFTKEVFSDEDRINFIHSYL